MDDARQPLWTTDQKHPEEDPGSARNRLSNDDGRVRSAVRPSDIPARGWKDIVLRVYRGFNDDRILMNAAGVTFYALLAVFPAIAALVSIYALFADPRSIEQHLNTAAGLLPGGALDVVRSQFSLLTSKGSGALGIGFVISLAISLWSANGGIKGLFDALNVVYGEEEKRSFVHLNAISLCFTLGLIAFLLIALACLVALPAALNFLPGFIGEILSYCRWPVLLVLVALALSLIYRFGPSREEPKWRWVSWGSAFASIGWLVFSALFTWYAASFGSFNKTYGSLGAVVGFMIWMWLSTVVILLGGELNAEPEHQAARDSTESRPKRMGARRAAMANTLGRPQG